MYKNKVGILPVVDNEQVSASSQTVIFFFRALKYPVMERKEFVVRFQTEDKANQNRLFT